MKIITQINHGFQKGNSLKYYIDPNPRTISPGGLYIRARITDDYIDGFVIEVIDENTFKLSEEIDFSHTNLNLKGEQMENNKHYIPDIEDIRVGYEFEILHKDLWMKEDFDPLYLSFYLAELAVHKIRTPYLTKEQIEAEGWEIKYNHDVLVGFQKGEGMYPVLAEYNTESHHLTIRTGSWYPEETIYYGKCPSINEFRKICKLLGI
jgi:hypothetical protein